MKLYAIALGIAFLAAFVILSANTILDPSPSDPFLAEASNTTQNIVFYCLVVLATVASCLATARVASSPETPRAKLSTKSRTSHGQVRQTATIRFFNRQRRFGFATLEDGEEVFIHSSKLEEGFDERDLRKGTRIRLTVSMDKQGPAADKIEIEGNNSH